MAPPKSPTTVAQGGAIFYKSGENNRITDSLNLIHNERFLYRSRVIQKMGLKEDPTNHLLMHAVGANVAGQIGSVVAGGMILS